jgi:MarR family transcriptional regulator for hemolysin
MDMTRNQLELNLAMRVSLVSRAWRQLADQALTKFGVSGSTGWCLVYINRLGDGTRQADLAREIGVREASLVRTLHQLEAAGLVARRTNPEDRRANHMILTDEGRLLARRIEARLEAMRNDLLADTPSADIEATLRVCDALMERLGS